jgi:hypothetical protein
MPANTIRSSCLRELVSFPPRFLLVASGLLLIGLIRYTGMGFSIGLVYVPTYVVSQNTIHVSKLTSELSMAVPSQYFERKRALAMGLVATGSGLGGALQPIMLNKLFYSSLGFHNAVRISGAFNAVLLFTGVALMRTRDIPGKKAMANQSLTKDFGVYIKDIPYVCTVMG